MSANGQVVIPADVRKLAKLKPSAQFLVINKGSDIVLKHVTKEDILVDLDLAERIGKAEDDFEHGRYTKADTRMSAKEIDDLLMS
ncbi:MAG: AbrB/MazE/SpoVT family DNA-binding domain-containing protein, partial [Candidatus Altiarchaeota archaeon]|nr:AbrB/MazE/SpoVT family DNA-binding domain-containing protein [Candidatus Altiarchaeota archaeon]